MLALWDRLGESKHTSVCVWMFVFLRLLYMDDEGLLAAGRAQVGARGLCPQIRFSLVMLVVSLKENMKANE